MVPDLNVYRSSFRQDEEDEMSEVREEGISEESVDAGVKHGIPVTGCDETQQKRIRLHFLSVRT